MWSHHQCSSVRKRRVVALLLLLLSCLMSLSKAEEEEFDDVLFNTHETNINTNINNDNNNNHHLLYNNDLINGNKLVHSTRYPLKWLLDSERKLFNSTWDKARQSSSSSASSSLSSSSISSSSSSSPSSSLPKPRTLEAILKLPIRPGLVRFSASKPRTLPKPEKRGKRGREVEMVQDVCPSISEWVPRTEALDPYGNKLTVVQRIPINGSIVNQYFYETFCAHNYLDYFGSGEEEDFFGHVFKKRPRDTQCRGVDRDLWSSQCRENLIWTYGKVVTNMGEAGWSVIAIRGSCGCAIWPKRDVKTFAGRGRRVTASSNRFHLNLVDEDPFVGRI